MMIRVIPTALLILFTACGPETETLSIKIGTFSVDASPAIGSPLAYDPTKEVTEPLNCRGIVLLGEEEPIVLCAVDWIGIGNESQTFFREGLAEAAGTRPERVAVHTLHQHDAPRSDFSVDRLLAPFGLNGDYFDSEFAHKVIERAADAVRSAVNEARPVTHVGMGEATVEKVASNRRILGPDGKVAATRWTACKDPELRAQPVGVIDPTLKLISFWNQDEPLAALTYYATHPQSYYRTGGANPDFPGMARNQREEETGVFHLHFAGAGGNIGAGKWNDGSPENRQILTERVASGMREAWTRAEKNPVSVKDLGWESLPVQLPAAHHLAHNELRARLEDKEEPSSSRLSAATALAWLDRAEQGDRTGLSCLRLGRARILHMPGELFVEYQLAAQAMRPDLFVAMAAYGDYAPGYIGTREAYEQGGYETGPEASLVAPEVEDVLLEGMRKLLNSSPD